MRLKFDGRSPVGLAIIVLALVLLFVARGYNFDHFFGESDRIYKLQINQTGQYLSLPKILLEKGIYNNDSFVNEIGVVPAYWEGESNASVQDRRDTYGPCFAYSHPVDWEAEIELYNANHVPTYSKERIDALNAMDLRGCCRPGFIIIGAGKCGTSSLYHYVTSHPKVLPASEKQIHYFKYHSKSPLKWYYQHFPQTSSFLAAGALMTGEASPGYLPYPDVVNDMQRRLSMPRLLMIGRNPIERSFSSYRYNYVRPTINYLKKGKEFGLGEYFRLDVNDTYIEKNQPDEYYEQFLLSFEDMMRAELKVLRECFAPGSEAEIETRRKWRGYPWVDKEYERRENEGLPPLLDLDGFCYGNQISDTVPRRQWKDIVEAQPDKILPVNDLHLTQALIGRSLYLFPLEWWYAAFPKEHIYFVCTEELQDFTGESLNKVSQFLGLPRFDNFSGVVGEGAFNVGGHRGYDHEISWEEIHADHAGNSIPLSEQLRLELVDFIRPYNERLFNMTGRRCNWQ